MDRELSPERELLLEMTFYQNIYLCGKQISNYQIPSYYCSVNYPPPPRPLSSLLAQDGMEASIVQLAIGSHFLWGFYMYIIKHVFLLLICLILIWLIVQQKEFRKVEEKIFLPYNNHLPLSLKIQFLWIILWIHSWGSSALF